MRISGCILTLLYFAGTFFNKKKAKQFNQKKNFFHILRKKKIQEFNSPQDKEFNEKFLKGGRYDFNGVFLPKIENTYLLRTVYDDVLKIYTEYNDNYNYKLVDEMDKTIPEGTYCYYGSNGEDITIKNGDVVIDAGAWIGDFSAYASKKGAHVYAFEPSPSNLNILKKTVEYNKGNGGDITIIPLGLGDKNEILDFFENEDDENTGGNSYNIPKGSGNKKLEMIKLDNWIERNNIEKVDFIKVDIEGFERNMLLGATKTLKKFEPILSVCTYHFLDDPTVLRDIILEANPKYKIIQRKMKLFAYVDNL